MNDPLVNALGAVFNSNIIDGIFYFMEKLDEYEKKQRYDDNARKLLENAFRLYEQGELTKDQLIALVKLLPETKKVEPVALDLEKIKQLLQ